MNATAHNAEALSANAAETIDRMSAQLLTSFIPYCRDYAAYCAAIPPGGPKLCAEHLAMADYASKRLEGLITCK